MSNRAGRRERRRIITTNGERSLPEGAVLTGRRIDPSTEVGKHLKELREQFDLAAGLDLPAPTDDESVRQRLNASLQVPISQRILNMDIMAERRRQLICGYIEGVITKVTAERGQRPKSIGVPTETYEEVKAACHGRVDIKIVVAT